MHDSADHVETVLQWLSTSPTAREINREIGDLSGDLLAGAPLLSYVRYNIRLTSGWIREMCGEDLPDREIEDLQDMDEPHNMVTLARLTRTAAKEQIVPEHLPAAFDL